MARFLSDIDQKIPLNFLPFRPNFVLENHLGAYRELMDKSVKKAEEAGLKNVDWSGRVGISGSVEEKKVEGYEREEAKLAGGIAQEVGCSTHPRDCGGCSLNQDCPVKNYKATRTT